MLHVRLHPRRSRGINIVLLFTYGKPDWKPMLVGYLGLLLQGGCLLAIGTFISTTTRNQIVAGGATFAVCLLLWVLDWVSSYETTALGKVIAYISMVTHFEPFSKGVHRYQGRDLLSVHDLLRSVPHGPLHGIAEVEGVK